MLSDIAIKMIIGVIITAVLAFGANRLWHNFTAQYVEQGRVIGDAAARKELNKTIKMLRDAVELQDAQLKNDIIAFNEIAAKMKRMAADTKAVNIAMTKAIAENKQRVLEERKQVQWIKDIIPVGDTQCKRTDSVLDQLYR